MLLPTSSVFTAASVYVTFANALPTDHASPKDPRALQLGDHLLALNTALNVSIPLLTPTNSLFADPPKEPHCFIDAFIPLIDPKDCLYTDYAISTDPRFESSVTKPFRWTKRKAWKVRSCAIAVAPNVRKPDDTFSALDILVQAHRVLEKCEKSPYGLRGGYVPFGNGDFRVTLARPMSNVSVDRLRGDSAVQ